MAIEKDYKLINRFASLVVADAFAHDSDAMIALRLNFLNGSQTEAGGLLANRPNLWNEGPTGSSRPSQAEERLRNSSSKDPKQQRLANTLIDLGARRRKEGGQVSCATAELIGFVFEQNLMKSSLGAFRGLLF